MPFSIPPSESPLVAAVIAGSLQGVVGYLRAEAVDREDLNRALRVACSFGDERIVPVLLASGADPGSGDSDEPAAIEFAAAYGHVGVLEQVAGCERQPPLGLALEHAAFYGHARCVGFLLSRSAQPSVPALAKALLGTDLGCIRVLVDAGANRDEAAVAAQQLAQRLAATDPGVVARTLTNIREMQAIEIEPSLWELPGLAGSAIAGIT